MIVPVNVGLMLPPLKGEGQQGYFPFLLPSYNEEIEARGRQWNTGRERQNGYNVIKRKLQDDVVLFAKRLFKPVVAPVVVIVEWREPSNHRDPDGVSSGGKKIVLDGLGPPRKGARGWNGAGILHCDGRHCICGFVDLIRTDAQRPGVVVTLVEVDRG